MNKILFTGSIFLLSQSMISCGKSAQDQGTSAANVEIASQSPTEAADSQIISFTGSYTDSNDGSTLLISPHQDGRYKIDISLFRLTDITDGIGEAMDNSLKFKATDAAGNPIHGNITLQDSTATVTFTESSWSYLPDGTSFHFSRDSEALIQERQSLMGRTFSGSGNGGGLATTVTIQFMSNETCVCTSDFYQAFTEPVAVDGWYRANRGIVEVICRPEGFEEPVEWYFSIKNNGQELSFNNSDHSEEGSIGNDWLILNSCQNDK